MGQVYKVRTPRLRRPGLYAGNLAHSAARASVRPQIVSYHSPMTLDGCLAIKDQVSRHMPTHQPLWTAIGVASLAMPEMQIEIEMWADVASTGGK